MHCRALRDPCRNYHHRQGLPSIWQHMSVDSKEGGSDDKRAIASKEDDDSVDKRVWPIAASTFITGSAVGVALPVMPLFAAELGLTTAEFGLVGSVFGGARLLSNLPMGVAVERFGRRPLLVLGPALAGTAMIGTGLSGSLPVLLGWRVLTGLGGSAQLTGAQNYLADISKPSNRARTLAPMSAAFSAGASLGPAIGGVLAQNFGVAPCFYYVGGAIGLVGVLNFFMLPETKKKVVVKMTRARRDGGVGGVGVALTGTGGEEARGGRRGGGGQGSSATGSAVAETSGLRKNEETGEEEKQASVGQTLVATLRTWKRLAADRTIGAVLSAHLAYWCVLAGSQFTLMPILASQELGMTPGAIGSIFAMVSATNVVGSQVSAHLSDKFGRKTTIVPGLASIALAVSGIPYAQDGSHLTALMFLWGVGGASVSAGPTAFVADLVEEKDRAQALAMLRSCGDLGLLIGAGATGALAFSTSMETAFLANSALLAAATANVALRAEEKSVEPSGGGP